MTARSVYYRDRRFAITGEGYGVGGCIGSEDGKPLPDFRALLTSAVLCCESRIRDGLLIGDPTEGALLVLAAKGGVAGELPLEHRPRIAEIPFDSERKFMATFHPDGTQVRMYVKGAPDVLLLRAASYLSTDGALALAEAARSAFLAENASLAGRAMRVMAMAMTMAGRDIPAESFDAAGDLMVWADKLLLIGLVCIIDPSRPEAREAIALCRQAGITVKMITGDHSLTAAAIARELGLQGAVLTGAELVRFEVDELSRRIGATAVFARVAPEHKVKIVRALKALGHVVAWPWASPAPTYGVTMATATLLLLNHARASGPTYALTLAFTTFVLFQLFNVFNARHRLVSAGLGADLCGGLVYPAA